MAKKQTFPRENQIIKALANPQSLTMRVIDKFVVFPKRLSRIFPGSYLTPEDFLRALDIHQKTKNKINALISNKVGTVDKQIFQYTKDNFELMVLRGLTNREVLNLARLAHQGFNDASVRAQYQTVMYNILLPFITKKEEPNYDIRIFDDCLATGDSIAGYLSTRLQNKEALSKRIEVTVTVATLQSILFLKAFAQAHNFNLKIKAGFVACGLSDTNYIVFPDIFLTKLDKKVRQQLESYRESDGNIYVVGDMGEAARGIEKNEMSVIRKKLGDRKYCSWNDSRCDPHGDHPGKQKKFTVCPNPRKKSFIDAYLARGGYLPYIFDQMTNPNFPKTNKTLVNASRKWTKEYGFGLAIKNFS